MKENGTKLLNTFGDYKLYEITTVEGVMEIPKTEQWCTYDKEYIELEYLHDGACYYVTRENEPFAIGFKYSYTFIGTENNLFKPDDEFLECVNVLGVWVKLALEFNGAYTDREMEEINRTPIYTYYHEHIRWCRK